MSKLKMEIELEMDSNYVEQIWPKLQEIIKDEKVKANVKTEYIKKNYFPSSVSFIGWMQDGGDFFSK
jgi:hypothetical protein